MKRILLGAMAATAAVLLLAGCSTGPKTYATIADLKKAYVAAGGECTSGQALDLSSIATVNAKLKGLKGYSCNSSVALFTTTSKASRDAVLKMFATIATAQKVKLQWILGEKWLVGGTSFDAAKYAGKLGGQVKK